MTHFRTKPRLVRWLQYSLFAIVAGGLAMPTMAAAPAAPRAWPTLSKVDDRSKIAPRADDARICFCLYTVQDGTLKLSAQLYPLMADDPHQVTLEIERDGAWQEIATAPVHRTGWTATFRVEDWDTTRDFRYRVRHALGSSYGGTVRHDPVEKPVIVAAAFTGNSPGPGGGKISKRDVVDSILKLDPDVLFFTGDQVYPHFTHTENWLAFGELFGDATRDRPTVCLPDDHDVGQPNLWGGGGRPVPTDVDGGYTRPAEYVKMVERQQTAHLPDPFDPTPIEQGIGVYYTSLNVGGVDFALIEDRKFKSGCADLKIKERGLGSRPDHIERDGYDPRALDVPGKEMLGERQIKFLDEWSRDWDDAVMKSVVSQTAFGATSTHHSANKAFYWADLDANGWPQTGRDEAVAALRRSGSFHICGDQHLSTMGQYGIADFGDAGWWFCVPSIANLYPRWWQPRHEPVHKLDGPLDYLGDYLDGFDNKLTFHAHTNPRPSGREPAELHDRMPGFGVIRFNKPQREITIECWPRMVDVTDSEQQYTGWPRTISQFDNLGRGVAYLPTLEIAGASDAVVEVVDEADGSVVYTVRILGNKFRPLVYRDGKYTVRVLDGEKATTRSGIDSLAPDEAAELRIDL